jgi:predicted kinase
MEVSRVIADAHRLASSFSPLPTPEARPTIIVVSGLPGTGKTYFCRRLAERLPFIIIESDALRKKLFPAPTYSAEESTYLFRMIHQLIEELLEKGTPVILDATNLAERNRERIYNIAERTNARLILVRVEAPPELVQKRLKSRTKRPDNDNHSDADWTVYQKMKAADEKINRRHFTVDTSRDITPAIDKIIKEVNR